MNKKLKQLKESMFGSCNLELKSPEKDYSNFNSISLKGCSTPFGKSRK